MKKFSEIKLNKKKINYILDNNLNRISDLVDGFNCGELITIGARAGKGKTALSVNLMCEFNKQGLKTLFISCEMSAEEIKIKVNKYKKRANITLKPNKLFIDDGKFDWLKIEKDIKECKPNIVFVDFVQLVKDNAKKVAEKLKHLAQQYNCVVFALAELNKGSETAKPRLGSLKGCGNIDQYSDQVWFIWETPLEWEDSNDHIPMIYVAKNRKGQTGYVPVDFEKENQTFCDLGDKSNESIFDSLAKYDKDHDWKANLAKLKSSNDDESIGYIVDGKFII